MNSNKSYCSRIRHCHCCLGLSSTTTTLPSEGEANSISEDVQSLSQKLVYQSASESGGGGGISHSLVKRGCLHAWKDVGKEGYGGES